MRRGRTSSPATRTPEPIAQMQERFPVAYDELEHAVAELELHYRDMQDVEFTVEQAGCYLLQTRGAKRTAAAALACAVALVEEGMIDRRRGCRRIDPESLEQLLHPTIDPDCASTSSPGARRLARCSVRPRGIRRGSAVDESAAGE